MDIINDCEINNMENNWTTMIDRVPPHRHNTMSKMTDYGNKYSYFKT